MRPIASLTKFALLALASCAIGGNAMAQPDAPMGGQVPAGWVWQGTWQDGRWQGQWIPGPGPGAPMPGTPMPGAYAPPQMQGGIDPETDRMAQRCWHYHHDGVAEGAIAGGVVGGVVGNRLSGGNRVAGTIGGAAVGAVAGAGIEHAMKRHRDHQCERFFRDHGDNPAGFQGGPPPYAPGPYPAMAPPGYMMVPVVTGPQQPCVETTTTTTTYYTDKRRRVTWSRPVHRKEKRVYTGS